MIQEKNHIILQDIKSIVTQKLSWKKFINKTILITGGNGFLPSYIVKSLLAANELYKLNIKIICIIRSSKSKKNRLRSLLNIKNLKLIHHNLQSPLPKKFPKSDFIIHSASQASPKYFKVDPVGTLIPNSIGTYYLLEYAIKCKAEKFLFVSSGEVYGYPLNYNKVVKENDYGFLDPTILRSCYAESKRMGETMCISYSKQFKLKTSIVRPFHTYGPGLMLDDGRVFADFIANVVEKKDLLIKGLGSEKRCFCYISDATIGFLRVLINGDDGEAYNIANPDCEISIKKLAELICKIYPKYNLKVKNKILASKLSYLKSPITRILTSIEKVKKKGWKPKISLEEGFKRTIDSFIV